VLEGGPDLEESSRVILHSVISSNKNRMQYFVFCPPPFGESIATPRIEREGGQGPSTPERSFPQWFV